MQGRRMWWSNNIVLCIYQMFQLSSTLYAVVLEKLIYEFVVLRNREIR